VVEVVVVVEAVVAVVVGVWATVDPPTVVVVVETVDDVVLSANAGDDAPKAPMVVTQAKMITGIRRRPTTRATQPGRDRPENPASLL
jgi:hypothetical protein